MPGEFGHRRGLAAQRCGGLNRVAGPQREACGGLRADAEDGVDGARPVEPLDRLAAKPRELREDQRARGVGCEVDLVVVHHVVGPLRSERW